MLQALDRRTCFVLAGIGSAALLAGAFAFQHLGGLPPCQMCLWQRWPHGIAVGIALFGTTLLPLAFVALLGGLTMVINAGIALFHTGVERDWWEGPTTCGDSAAQDLGGMSASDLLDTTTGPQIVLCDEVAWEMFGLSMASWNGIICLVLAAIWFAAARRAPV